MQVMSNHSLSRLPPPLDRLSFTPVAQALRRGPAPDVPAAVRAALAAGGGFAPGARVAIAVGSRGIDQIDSVVRETVRTLHAAGAAPFIVPAMGSHGGTTADGQRAILAGYGITASTVGAPIESSLDTVLVGRTRPTPFDRLAAAADAIVVINRVKCHSILTGDIASGLCKMTAVGLGKHAGAQAIHAAGLESTLLSATAAILEAVPMRLGIALVEDPLDHLTTIEGVPPAHFAEADRRLLRQARAYFPTLPFDPLDAVVFRWMGKDISGAGMDPNVIGLHRRLGGAPTRRIARLTAMRLTPASHGNGVGVGMADLIPQSLADAIDLTVTRANADTSGWPAGATLPPTLPTEAATIARLCQGDPTTLRVDLAPTTLRGVIAEDSSHLDRFLVSPALLAEVAALPGLSVDGAAALLEFDGAGRLLTECRTS